MEVLIMEDKRFNGEQLRNDDYNDNYYEDTSSADNAEALEHDMEYNDISSDFKEESAQSFDQTISNEEPAYSGHSAKAPEVVYHSGGDQVYSYEKYKAQFSAQEHSPKSAAKKKSGSGKKAALIACSLALAMGLGFGGGILNGETAIILLAQEEYETALTAKLNNFEVSITRFDAAEVAAEVEHAREIEKQMAKEAREKMRAERTEEFKETVSQKSEELKNWFSHLGKKE